MMGRSGKSQRDDEKQEYDVVLALLRNPYAVVVSLIEGAWGGLSTKAATIVYLEGNSATLYLIDRFGMEKVREILGLLATGQSFAAAMQNRLFMPYDEFQRRWMDHLSEKMGGGRS